MAKSSQAPTTLESPLYFPVLEEPLKMSPGLYRLGQDFGNGPADSSFFQRDRQAELYRRTKQQVVERNPERVGYCQDPAALQLLEEVAGWMTATLAKERGRAEEPGPTSGSCVEPRVRTASPLLPSGLWDLSLDVQEDFAVLAADETGGDRVVLLSVCFPSGWRPERLVGRDFEAVHAPVPAFDQISKNRGKLVRAMTERGPYVRFVWTVSADAFLDHHPEWGRRDPWDPSSVGYLRVERQVTVPFPAYRGSLFLIRTYLYPFARLGGAQKATLAQAIRLLPPEIRKYKGLDSGYERILRHLDHSA